MTTPADDIKNCTWRDKEYYKLYQRELYKKTVRSKMHMRTLRKANNIYKFKEPYDHKQMYQFFKSWRTNFERTRRKN